MTQTADELRERLASLEDAKRAVLRQMQDLDPTDSLPVATLNRHLDRLESEGNRIDFEIEVVKKKLRAVEFEELVYNLAERVAALEAEVILLEGRTRACPERSEGVEVSRGSR